MDLSKKDKRLCRELIYTSLEKECAKFVNDLHQAAEKPIPLAELNAPYREVNGQKVDGPWHQRYIYLYRMMHRFDRYIARTYDGITGGHYFDAVLMLYCDNLLTDEDIARFDEETRDSLSRLKKFREEF